MKKVIILQMLAGSVSMPALANWHSQLSLTNYDNSKFIMYFDQNYFSTPSNTYNITDITPGLHHVRVFKPFAQMYGACGIPVLLFDGEVNFPSNSRIIGQIDMQHQMLFTSIIPLAQPVYDPNGGYNYGYGSASGTNYGYPDYDAYGNNYGTGYGNGYGGSSGNGGWNNYPQNYGMSQQQFDALKTSISSLSFENSKLTVAEQAVASNHMTAAQVEEVIKLFTFESTKLDFAKYAYGKTVDRGNYYLVNNAFDFESSITDLAGYINTYHG